MVLYSMSIVFGKMLGCLQTRSVTPLGTKVLLIVNRTF